jgi:iron complex outermembrane receptor protein
MRRADMIGSGLLVLFTATTAAAQAGVVRGTVSDSTGVPIVGAIVTVEGTGLRTGVTAAGSFEIGGVPAGTQTVRVRALGFIPSAADVAVQAGDVVQQDFTLTHTLVEFSPVEVVVGSRRRHTAAEELAVPVDVYPAETLIQQGTTETADVLQAVSPSVNFPRHSVADADDIVRPFTLRGLSPDHTLVLVNGLRRHRTALVHIFAYGMAAGSSGVDLNAFPVSVIDRIEVLRHGASAQYGSDALAGVVNLVVKDGAFRPFLNTHVGRYLPDDYSDDGTAVDVNGGWGIGLGRGSLGLFAEYRHRDPTNRAFAEAADQIVPGDADSVDAEGDVVIKRNPVEQPNHHWGDGREQDVMTFANLRLPVNESGSTEAYAFGGWSFREGTGQGFRRQGISDRNWPEIYPLGYLPTFDPDVLDVSAAAGVRGTLSGWGVDIGASFGRNEFEYNLTNTLNVSLGPCLDVPCAPGLDGVLGTADDPGIPNQTDIFAGTLGASEASVAANLARSVDVGLPSPMNVALGAAYRREYYSIEAGEPASYIQGGHLNRDSGPAPPGSQVFGGFQPSSEVDESRGNVGAFLDLETNLSSQLLANIAGRFEDYSDFGSRVTGKLAFRFQPSRQLVFRAAASTEFRAPSLAQSLYSSKITTFVLDTIVGGQRPVEAGIFPVNSAPAQALGAEPLKDETAVNVSGGLAFSPLERLNLTVDGYYIRISDRIILTGLLGGEVVQQILADAGLAVESAQYFTNALDTRTTGMDVTINYQFQAANGVLDLSGAFNYGKNKIVDENPLPPELAGTGITTLFDPLSRVALEKERPSWRSTLTAGYSQARWHGLLRSLWYGEFSSAQLGACEECVQEYGTKALFDAEVGYRFDQVNLSVGMRNLFDTFPDQASIDNSFGIFPWPAASPFGYNGRHLYTRAEIPLGP